MIFEPDPVGVIDITSPATENATLELEDVVNDIEEQVRNESDSSGAGVIIGSSTTLTEHVCLPFIMGTLGAACEARCGACNDECHVTLESIDAVEGKTYITTAFIVEPVSSENMAAARARSPANNYTHFVQQVWTLLNEEGPVPREPCGNETSDANWETQITVTPNGTDAGGIGNLTDWLANNATDEIGDLTGGLGDGAGVEVELCEHQTCSGHGTCAAGTCICDPGFDGFQCHVFVGYPSQTPTRAPSAAPSILGMPSASPTTSPVLSSPPAGAVRGCPGAWRLVFDQESCSRINVDEPKPFIDALFRESGLARYDTYGTPYAYLERLRNPELFSAYDNLIDTWRDTNNVLGLDFDIFSSEADLESGQGAWSYCYYNVPGVGFPNICGPDGPAYNQWSSGKCQAIAEGGATVVSAVTQFQFYVCDMSLQDEDEEPPIDEFESYQIAGKVVNAQGEPVPATVHVYSGYLDPDSDAWQSITPARTTGTEPEPSTVATVASFDLGLPVPEECGDATASGSSSSDMQEAFEFEGVPQGLYTLVAVPDDDSDAYSPVVLPNVPHNTSDVQLVLAARAAQDQVKIELVYTPGDFGELDLMVNFRVNDDTLGECSLSSATRSDGSCGCGGVRVLSSTAATSGDAGERRDTIVIETVHETIYRFFVARRSSVSGVPTDGVQHRTDGRCGAAFPLSDGRKSQCPTEEILWDDGTRGVRPCCSQSGYCGATTRHCDCMHCIDYRIFQDDSWQTRYRPDGICRDPLNPGEDGEVTFCPPFQPVVWWDMSTETRPCCSANFECSSRPSDCTCATCTDFRTLGSPASSGPAFGPSNGTGTSVDAAPRTLEESGARVIVSTSSGVVSDFSMPAGDIANNYNDQHKFVPGEPSPSSSFVRVFCLDGHKAIPAVHEYTAPRYFRFQGEMLDIDTDRCPTEQLCEYAVVRGMTLAPELNGLYMQRNGGVKDEYRAFPGYDIHSACSVAIVLTNGTRLAQVDTELGAVWCSNECSGDPSCEGFVLSESDNGSLESCMFFAQPHLCGGGKYTSRDLSKVVYERIAVSAVSGPRRWYTKVDTMFTDPLHLYRGEADTLLGGLYSWHFDRNLEPGDGFIATGADALGTGTPDGVVQWLAHTMAWAYPVFLAEDPFLASVSLLSDSCDFAVPTVWRNLSLLSCACENDDVGDQAVCDLPCPGLEPVSGTCKADPTPDWNSRDYAVSTGSGCTDAQALAAHVNVGNGGCVEEGSAHADCTWHHAPPEECQAICDWSALCGGFEYIQSGPHSAGPGKTTAAEFGACYFVTTADVGAPDALRACYARQQGAEAGAEHMATCQAPLLPPDAPGTDFGCAQGMRWCGRGGYSATRLSACADAVASAQCATFTLRFAGTGLCLSRARWAVRAARCDAGDPLQAWMISSDGLLVGQGVLSSSSTYQAFFYTIGVVASAPEVLALQDPGSLEPFTTVAFEGSRSNGLVGVVQNANGARLCVAQSAGLGSKARFALADDEACAAFEIV